MKKLILAIAVASTLIGCGRIETGNVGVRTDFNKAIESTEVNPGWYGAFLTSVDEFTTKEVELQMNDMRPKAKDNLSLQDLDVSVFYKVAPGQIAEQRIKYQGMAGQLDSGVWASGYFLVERITRGAIYSTAADFDSLTIHSKRDDLETAITRKIQDDLNKSDPGVYTVTRAVVRQLLTDPALEKSIQASVQMQKQIEAKQLELKLAEAEAARKIVEAQGEATSNRLIAESLTGNLVQIKAIEAQAKFAGQGTHTVVMPSNTGALVNVGR
jgi:regulator of protease activity HflC (stomatin/prohibitin superfamily)